MPDVTSMPGQASSSTDGSRAWPIVDAVCRAAYTDTSLNTAEVTPLDTDSSTSATYLTIATMIERAAASFDWDRSASRKCLFNALSLIRIQRLARERRTASLRSVSRRGGLATWQLDRVMAYVDAHLTCNIQSAELAALVKLSRGHFARIFKHTVGIALVDYVIRLRIERAKGLMRDTFEPLAQIALACGFGQQSYFCRTFKRIVGERPSAWRRRNARGSNPTRLSA